MLIVISEFGRERLLRAGADDLPSTQTVGLTASGVNLDARAIVNLLENEFGVKLLLHEGGPSLFGSFIAVRIVNELFLSHLYLRYRKIEARIESSN